MTRTPIAGLVGAAGFSAAAALILLRRFYGAIGPVNLVVPMSLWVIAVVVGFVAYVVKRRRENGEIGLDRSQLNPMMVANFMLLGKASAWAGAVCGGVYTGLLIYIAPQLGRLAAAAEDLPGVISGALAGVALAVAGVVLERACEVSPPSDGQAAS